MILSRIFKTWSRRSHQSVVQRNLMRRAMQRKYTKTTAKCFNGWKIVIHNYIKIYHLLLRFVVRYDTLSVGVHFTHWKNKSNAWTTRQKGLHRCAVYKFGRRLKRLALQRWMLTDGLTLWGYEVKVQSCATFRRSRYVRLIFRAWFKCTRSSFNWKQKMQRLTVKGNAHFCTRLLHTVVRKWSTYASTRKLIKSHIKRLLTILMRATKRRLQSKAWQTWKILVCGREATQNYVAESILAVSMEHRRTLSLFKSCWSIWYHAIQLSAFQKKTAKQKCFQHWNVYVRRCQYERYEQLTERFHKAGLRGSQAEVQWALGKWQQFAFCVQIRQVADLERKIFLKSIRGENKKLRKMLLEYHKRGMFVLDGSKDYLVQRKIQPSLALNNYDNVDNMIAESYHGDIPHGVKLSTRISDVAFLRSERPVPPKTPSFVLGLLTPPKRKPHHHHHQRCSPKEKSFFDEQQQSPRKIPVTTSLSIPSEAEILASFKVEEKM